jgi:hypothetical protein
MSWEHGQSHTATGTKVSLNALLLGPFRIDITPVASMAVNGPRTTAGTLGAQSFELIFPELDREKFPKSSAPIKLLCLGLHEAAPRSLSTNVSHPRHARISQRYMISLTRHAGNDGSRNSGEISCSEQPASIFLRPEHDCSTSIHRHHRMPRPSAGFAPIIQGHERI